jgi:hypothetical protein
MAISIKFKRNTVVTSNTLIVTAGSGDTGKLQIQYNDSDIYNNLSGSSSDILSGASNSTINIPLEDDGTIPHGIYYFNFVASVGSSDTASVDFQTTALAPLIEIETDVYSPSVDAEDTTSYTVTNGSATSVSRTLSLIYPTGSNQTTLTASAAASATTLEISTSNVWTGAYQATLSYDLTYTVTTTSSAYDSYTYQEVGSGYEGRVVSADTLCNIYGCFEALRQKVAAAASNNRADYPTLLSNYTYMASLVTQYREAVSCGNTAALASIYAQIQYLSNGCGCNCSSDSTAPTRITGLGGIDTEEVQDIVGALLENATKYGINIDYTSARSLVIDNDAIYLTVYNDTGSTISKGKAVYFSGYDSAAGLPEVSLATNASANASAQAIGLVAADIASAASGRCVIYGRFTGDTSGLTVGSRLYLSTGGNLSSTEPSGAVVYQFIGAVGREDATSGYINVTPSRAFDFNTLVSQTTSVTTLQANFTEASAVASGAGMATLNTDGILVLSGSSGKINHLHSVNLYLSDIPAPSSVITFTLFSNSASAYNAAGVLATAIVPVSAATQKYRMFVPSTDAFGIVANKGENVYLGAASNEASWANNTVKVTAFYKQYTP